MFHPSRRTALITCALVLIALLSISIVQVMVPPPKDEPWRRIQQTGVILIGTDASYPPFEFLDSGNQIVGLDVDLGNVLAGKLGVKATYINIAYDGLYDALLTGKVDILISALADLPQSAGKATFTDPYFNAGEMLVVRKGSPVESMQDMAGHIVAVEYGSDGDAEARKWERRITGLTIQRYEDSDGTLQAVLAGDAEAAIVDGITARLSVSRHPNLMLASHVTDTLFAIATHSDSPILHDRLNEAVEELLKDGTIQELTDRWFAEEKQK
jgi:ABC-type amino acid transport substrate-binding protein